MWFPSRRNPRPQSRRVTPRLEALEDRHLLATFTVVNTLDNSNPGSLRRAILDANATTGLDTIAFSIGSGTKTIALTSALPPVTDPVVIDGTTQPGFAGDPLIVVSGTGAGATA